MAGGDVIELEAVVADGDAEAAAAFLRSTRTSRLPMAFALLVSLVAVLLALVTGRPAWLLLAPGWWGLRLVVTAVMRNRALHWLRTIALRPGSVIRAEWRDHDLAVRRPGSTVVFQYAGMEVAGSTGPLTMLWVHNTVGSRRRSVLALPSTLVPAEAVARFEHPAPPSEDPFGAAELSRVFRVPDGWPRRSYRLSTARKVALLVLLVIEAVLLAVLVSVGAWPYVAVVVVVLGAGLWWARSFAFRLAARRLPPGSVAGAELAGGRMVLALPDRRFDLPLSRLRNVVPVGADLVLLVVKGSATGPVPVPRALLSDDEIDRLRAAAGRRPMAAVHRSAAVGPVR